MHNYYTVYTYIKILETAKLNISIESFRTEKQNELRLRKTEHDNQGLWNNFKKRKKGNEQKKYLKQ